MAFFIGLVVIVASLSVGVFAGGGPTGLINFLQIPSVIIVLGPALVFLFAAAPWERVKLSLKLAFSNEAEASEEEIERACQLLNSFGVVGLLFAIIGFIVGLTLMLQDLSYPERLGPCMAVVSTNLYYGVLLRFLCYWATIRIKNRMLIDN